MQLQLPLLFAVAGVSRLLYGPRDQNTILAIYSYSHTYNLVSFTSDNQSNQFVVRIVPKAEN